MSLITTMETQANSLSEKELKEDLKQTFSEMNKKLDNIREQFRKRYLTGFQGGGRGCEKEHHKKVVKELKVDRHEGRKNKNMDKLEKLVGKQAFVDSQMKVVQRDGSMIRQMDNTYEDVKLAAVQQDGLAIKYIENPSEEVQLAAIKQNGFAIRYIENPTEKVKLAIGQQ